MLVFAFKIIRPITLSAVKKVSFHNQFFPSQEIFPQSKHFDTIKEFFHSQGIFPHLWKFSTIKEFFHNQKLSANKDQKVPLKALDPFNSKSYAKLFLTLALL